MQTTQVTAADYTFIFGARRAATIWATVTKNGVIEIWVKGYRVACLQDHEHVDAKYLEERANRRYDWMTVSDAFNRSCELEYFDSKKEF